MLHTYLIEHIEQITSTGSFFIASAAFVLTLMALIISSIFFSLTIRETNALRRIEAEQKKFTNALDLMRIVAGIKDLTVKNEESLFLQLIAIESLVHYPEYYSVYKVIENYYEKRDQSTSWGEMNRSIKRVIKKIEAGKRRIHIGR